MSALTWVVIAFCAAAIFMLCLDAWWQDKNAQTNRKTAEAMRKAIVLLRKEHEGLK